MTQPDPIPVRLNFKGRESRFYLDPRTPLEEARKELRSQCTLKSETPFNLKWLDVEGDPISVDTPRDWDEAIRLYMYNQETELILHGQLKGRLLRTVFSIEMVVLPAFRISKAKRCP